MEEKEEFLSKEFDEKDYYWDDRGFRVFTEHYLTKRGYCCKNFCRHCPYKVKKELKK